MIRCGFGASRTDNIEYGIIGHKSRYMYIGYRNLGFTIIRTVRKEGNS
jgi:hypothetical protein